MIESFKQVYNLHNLSDDQTALSGVIQVFIRKYTHARIGGGIKGSFERQVEKTGKRGKGAAGLRDTLYSLKGEKTKKISEQTAVGTSVRGRGRGLTQTPREGQASVRGRGRGQTNTPKVGQASVRGRGRGQTNTPKKGQASVRGRGRGQTNTFKKGQASVRGRGRGGRKNGPGRGRVAGGSVH